MSNRERLIRSYKAWGVALLVSLVTVGVELILKTSGHEPGKNLTVVLMVVLGLIGPSIGLVLALRAGLGRLCAGVAFAIIALAMIGLVWLAIPAYLLAPWISVAITEEALPQ